MKRPFSSYAPLLFVLLVANGFRLAAQEEAALVDLEVYQETVSQELSGAINTLDRFMMAGKEGDAERGARLLDMYESSPRKAEKEIGGFFEDRVDVFANYISIANDIYGYEIKENAFRGPNIEVEGRIETAEGFTSEFSARLVFRDLRWRILSLDID
ncbi:hypothetical protein [Pelagicoccus sp. SDUM812003]|uniref:hypothetical protein n=1 Tax=Pelagicoccus sp. SDUM812003 TaxID=3041267 RepID=UPI00280F5FB3|nr:hypothetical protein [Pelagicoccus sp. SDUM812003]MDQ8201802.1 hypothetical protein [Pelagicoccus sp. SDUM812003]